MGYTTRDGFYVCRDDVDYDPSRKKYVYTSGPRAGQPCEKVNRDRAEFMARRKNYEFNPVTEKWEKMW